MRRSKKGKRRRLEFQFSRGEHDELFGPGALLLEHCSDDSVSRWHARGRKLQAYNYKWFFELESQRAANQQAITAALQGISGIAVNVDQWCRAIKFRYSDTPLSCLGSLKTSGRFHYGSDIDPTRFPPFPALYAARDRETAHRELVGMGAAEQVGPLSGLDLALQKEQSLVWLTLRGEINNVFELTERNLHPFVDVVADFTVSDDARALAKELGIQPMRAAVTAAELLQTFRDPNWRGWPLNCSVPANSQVFGQLLSAAGFEGVQYSSVKTQLPAIAIFPRQFRNSTSSIYVPDAPATSHCARLDSNCYGDCERTSWD